MTRYRPDPGDPCPDCGVPLEGLATKCWSCGWYLAGQVASPSPRSVANDAYRGPERELRGIVKDALRLDGWDVIDTEQGWRADGSSRVDPGLADLIVMGYGLVAFVELKTAKGRQTDSQVRFGRRCKLAGVPYYVVRSVREAREVMDGCRRERAA